MNINERLIGFEHSPYIIAELSGNHNGSLEHALSLIQFAKNAGADAVKLQAYTPDTITYHGSGDEFIVKDGPWKGRHLYDLYKEAQTPWEWFPEMFRFAREIGITIFSSVFDKTSVDTLEKLSCPAYKISSFDITDTHLIRYTAKTNKPMIVSTGMASHREVMDAVHSFNVSSPTPADKNLALLHCVSAYPTPASEANLPRLGPLSEAYRGVIVGLSDHTLGVGVAAAAAAMGACIIEKHLCLSRGLGGPDASFSMEPTEFREMVRAVRDAWAASRHSVSGSQQANLSYRKSVYVVRKIARGDVLDEGNVSALRPARGLPARFYDTVLGSRATQDLEPGTPLEWEHIVSRYEEPSSA